MCSNSVLMLMPFLNSYSEAVRLQNGASAAEGRVEVYYKGMWGTVCDHSWDLKEGHLVCRMLGFSYALSVSCCSRYGRGRGSILLSGLRCIGNESSLFNCTHQQPTNRYCSHSNDAGVSCTGKRKQLGINGILCGNHLCIGLKGKCI